MWSDVFQLGPEAYIPILLISLVITLAAYGAFPLIFASVRKTRITQRKYVAFCYLFNILVFLAFFALNSASGGAVSTGGPYILWTGVFSAIGAKKLKKKGVISETCETEAVDTAISDSDNAKQEEQVVSDVDQENIEANSIDVAPQLRFCRHCGVEIAPDAEFCHRCGTKVVHV